ncbi:hypothetical protein WJX74_008616 [Apatococcus lobatus]|uniref:thioredoxin-dependent peroxiredoxin n=1 Tax=Apatococcus lobatus TaxID=904363 RepID=A0AAW1QBK4_9CHLO
MGKGKFGEGDRLETLPSYSSPLVTQDGKKISFAQLKGKGLVLFWYPKAGTAVCTKEACQFRDDYSKFAELNIEVLGISSDTPEANAAWAQKERLPFSLISDHNNTLRTELGVKNNLLGLAPGRQTFVMDTSGTCILSYTNSLNGKAHVEEALKAARKAVGKPPS